MSDGSLSATAVVSEGAVPRDPAASGVSTLALGSLIAAGAIFSGGRAWREVA